MLKTKPTRTQSPTVPPTIPSTRFEVVLADGGEFYPRSFARQVYESVCEDGGEINVHDIAIEIRAALSREPIENILEYVEYASVIVARDLIRSGRYAPAPNDDDGVPGLSNGNASGDTAPTLPKSNGAPPAKPKGEKGGGIKAYLVPLPDGDGTYRDLRTCTMREVQHLYETYYKRAAQNAVIARRYSRLMAEMKRANALVVGDLPNSKLDEIMQSNEEVDIAV